MMRKNERQIRDSNLRRHALDRARTRLGLDLTRRGLDKLIESIRSKRAAFLTYQTNDKTRDPKWRELWLVEHDGKQVAAVFDRTAGEIVSFLTPEMLHAVYGDFPEYVNVRKGTNPYVTFSKEERRAPVLKEDHRRRDTVVDTEWPPRVDRKI